MTPSGARPGYLALLKFSTGLELQYPVRLVAPPSWLGHTPFALWLVGALEPRTLVELGVHTGNSYCAFLQAVKARELATRCFGIDHWRGDEDSGFHGDEMFEELRAYHDPLYGSFSTLLRGSSEEALHYFSEGHIDLLHLGGFRTYEAAAHHFKSWLPRMSPRGVVLLHDTNVRERDVGIWRLWEEIVSRYPTFELTHSCGLGVVFVGSAPLSGPLEALFGAKTDAEIEAIRGYFARLGRSVVERRSLHDVATKIDAMQAHLAAVEKERDEARAVAAECEAKLRAVARQVDSQTVLLRRRMFVMARLQRELLVANQTLDEVFRTLDEVFRSKSWRLTVPIRWASAKVRRMLGRRFPGRS